MMKTSIIQKLRELETTRHIKIFYAAESGSRAWGFASPDSDYDVRFLYYHTPEWYFSLKKQADAIVHMENGGLLDFAGWELKKTLTLLLKGNMSLYEWMHSPIVYMQTEEHASFARLAREFYDPKALLFSYAALAENNYKDFLKKNLVKKKKYLYVLRTLAACRWIEHQKTPPPIEMNKLKNMLDKNKPIRDFLTHLIETKKTGHELGTIPAQTIVNQWIEKQLAHYKELAARLPALQKDSRILSKFLYDTAGNKQDE